MPTTVLGPWPGGLNLVGNRESSATLNSNELAEAINVCFTLDGNVEPRPGFKPIRQTVSVGTDLYVAGNVWTVLGSVKMITGEQCVFAQRMVAGQSTVFKICKPVNDSQAIADYYIYKFFEPDPGVEFTHCIGLDGGKPSHYGIVFFGKDDNTSYRLDGFIAVNHAQTPARIPNTDVPGMPSNIPGSDGGIVVKNRLFLWKFSTSYFGWSPAFYLLDWSKTQDAATVGDDVAGYEMIDPINSSDSITSVEFVNNNFYIFKRTQFYMYTYQASPKDDSYLRKISDEAGALATTLYRGNIVAFTNKGVFQVNNIEFTDLQSKLNLRFEIPIDAINREKSNAFITDFNDNLVLGFRERFFNIDSSEAPSKYYYYAMNGNTGAWSKWDFDYIEPGAAGLMAASPGSIGHEFQHNGTDAKYLLFTNFKKDRLVYVTYKPQMTPGTVTDYYLDREVNDVGATSQDHYIPAVSIKTKSSFGSSLLRYKKVQRTFIRFYLSDMQATNQQYPNGLWSAVINFDDYRQDYDTSHDPAQKVPIYPMAPDLMFDPPLGPTFPTTGWTVVYQREYQLPFRQLRATEFTFQLRRAFSKVTGGLISNDGDRPQKRGYYFLLSAVWFDYQDRAQI